MMNRSHIPANEPWPFSGEDLAARLARHGEIDESQVTGLVAEYRRTGIPVVAILRSRGQIDEVTLRDAISYVFGLPVVEVGTRAVGAKAIPAFPQDLALRGVAVPIGGVNGKLRIAVVDPTLSELSKAYSATGMTLDLVLATPTELEQLARGDAVTAPHDDDADVDPSVFGDFDGEQWNEAPSGVAAHRKAAWIAFASRIIAQAIGAFALVFLGLSIAGALPACGPSTTEAETAEAVEKQR